MVSAAPAGAPSTWAPLALSTYRWLWIAQLVSSIGTWMQNVGAQWMLIHEPRATFLTALAQAATLLPVLFVSLPAGVLADVFDRRRFLIGTQSGSVFVAGALAVLTALGAASPTVVLMLTFGLGVTAALSAPAWQAIQPQLVPRELIPQAATLGGLSMNAARAIGPALAGLLLAFTSPAILFGINAVTTGGVVVALVAWRHDRPTRRVPEPLVAALRAGSRYVVNSPMTRRILLRVAVFVLPGSALWALLAVVASERLGLGSTGYGLLLGALGAGAVAGALMLGRIRRLMGPNRLLALFSVLYGVGMLGAALATSPALVMALLLVSGIGWLVMMASFNTTLQLVLADWVRARGLSVYQIIFMGGQGLAAVLWGFVGEWIGVTPTLVLATALLLAGAATLPMWRLYTRELDLTISVPWPDPEVDLEPAHGDGPVLVEVTYCVADDGEQFLAAARYLGRVRRRTGALTWGLYQDVADHTVFVEVFTVATWGEHLRQHYERTTATDEAIVRRVNAFHLAEGSEGPEGRHLIAVATL